MYGDTEVIRRRTDQLRQQGTDLRALADHLVARTEALGWAGRAAESLRERIRDRATLLREVAERHDTAAGSLERHRVEVEVLQEQIAATERQAERLPDRSAFDAPPPGHRDWLTVELPDIEEPWPSST
jgi:chromosome segregation ATPase